MLSAFLLAACAQDKGPFNDTATILKNFSLSIPENSVDERWAANGIPSGVLLGIPPRGAITVCTVGRFNEGHVATNAHCILESRTKNPSDYYVLFPDKSTGQKTMVRVKSFSYLGNPDHDDVALLKLESSGEDRWASFSAQMGPFNDPRGDALYYLWAFDPVPSEARGLGSPNAFGIEDNGAVFSRKTCRVSKQIPRVARSIDGDKPVAPTEYNPSNKQLDAAIHLFVDDCTPTTVSGNSGGVLTNAVGEAIGIFHWHVQKRAFRSNQYYFGNKGIWQRIWGNDLPGPAWSSIFGVATEFSAIHP